MFRQLIPDFFLFYVKVCPFVFKFERHFHSVKHFVLLSRDKCFLNKI